MGVQGVLNKLCVKNISITTYSLQVSSAYKSCEEHPNDGNNTACYSRSDQKQEGKMDSSMTTYIPCPVLPAVKPFPFSRTLVYEIQPESQLCHWRRELLFERPDIRTPTFEVSHPDIKTSWSIKCSPPKILKYAHFKCPSSAKNKVQW